MNEEKNDQNPNLLDTMINLVNKDEISSIKDCQTKILARYEKTNEMLVNCNSLAQTRFSFVMKDLKIYKQQLNSMKKDLDQIYLKLKSIKQKVSKCYPEQYTMAKTKQSIEEEDDGE